MCTSCSLFFMLIQPAGDAVPGDDRVNNHSHTSTLPLRTSPVCIMCCSSCELSKLLGLEAESMHGTFAGFAVTTSSPGGEGGGGSNGQSQRPEQQGKVADASSLIHDNENNCQSAREAGRSHNFSRLHASLTAARTISTPTVLGIWQANAYLPKQCPDSAQDRESKPDSSSITPNHTNSHLQSYKTSLSPPPPPPSLAMCTRPHLSVDHADIGGLHADLQRAQTQPPRAEEDQKAR
ncbi:hypothetical protein L1887_60842 [Cichorium endivia]|nr:hypothetical protein L1887_60842 [Cichorium endivia]